MPAFDDEAAFGRRWRLGAEDVAHAPAFADILEKSIVGDEILFESCAEAFAQDAIGIQIKFLAVRRNMDIPFHAALGCTHRSITDLPVPGVRYIVGDLAVQVAHPVRSTQSPQRAW